MTRWKDGKLDLGTLGYLELWEAVAGGHSWSWLHGSTTILHSDPLTTSRAAARRAAIAWLRRALKQATKRLEGGK